jgi:hypothetical protein
LRCDSQRRKKKGRLEVEGDTDRRARVAREREGEKGAAGLG